MKPEIIEALALELTKSKLINKDTTASGWVEAYKASLSEIEAELSKNRAHHKPSTAGQRNF